MMRRLPQIAGLLAVAVIVLSACGARTVRGSGNVIAQERNVSDFDSVDLAGAGRVIITQGDTESLTIETDDNLMEHIKTTVRGRTLGLDFTKKLIPIPTESIIFRLSVINLAEIESSGAGRFEIDELDTDRLQIEMSGAGAVELAGTAEAQDIELSGVGGYAAPDLKSQTARVEISGAGGVEIWVLNTLDVDISGAGNVNYFGMPIVDQDISGLGRVHSQGEK